MSKIEAYGVKGMQSKPWRKVFKSDEALDAWVEKTGAEIHGTRELCGYCGDDRHSEDDCPNVNR